MVDFFSIQKRLSLLPTNSGKMIRTETSDTFHLSWICIKNFSTLVSQMSCKERITFAFFYNLTVICDL